MILPVTDNRLKPDGALLDAAMRQAAYSARANLLDIIIKKRPPIETLKRCRAQLLRAGWGVKQR